MPRVERDTGGMGEMLVQLKTTSDHVGFGSSSIGAFGQEALALSTDKVVDRLLLSAIFIPFVPWRAADLFDSADESAASCVSDLLSLEPAPNDCVCATLVLYELALWYCSSRPST